MILFPLIRRLLSAVCRLVCLLFLFCGCFLFAQEAKDVRPRLLLSHKVLRSPSKRFTVLGPDSRENMELTSWAEVFSAKIEKAIGLKMPFGSARVFRIVVRFASDDESEADSYTFFDSGERPDEQNVVVAHSGRVTTTQAIVGGRFVQRLVIDTYDKADPEQAREALCQLLLDGYVVDCQLRLRRSAGSVGTSASGRTGGPESEKKSERQGEQELKSIPAWFALGMAQNLYPSFKARNSEIVLGKWQRGELTALADFLRPAGEEEGANATNDSEQESSGREEGARTIGAEPGVSDQDSISGVNAGPRDSVSRNPAKAMSGLIVGWLLSLNSRAERFERIFARVAEGKPLSPEWFATCIPSCDSVVSLEEKWNKWILKQKSIIYEPGLVTPALVSRLKTQLVLYPGDIGVPSEGDFVQGMKLRELIDKRKDSWIPSFCRSKSMALRLFALGRGEELKNVVESYCAFLDALQRRKSKRYLEKLLGKAEKDLESLSKKVASEPGH